MHFEQKKKQTKQKKRKNEDISGAMAAVATEVGAASIIEQSLRELPVGCGRSDQKKTVRAIRKIVTKKPAADNVDNCGAATGRAKATGGTDAKVFVKKSSVKHEGSTNKKTKTPPVEDEQAKAGIEEAGQAVKKEVKMEQVSKEELQKCEFYREGDEFLINSLKNRRSRLWHRAYAHYLFTIDENQKKPSQEGDRDAKQYATKAVAVRGW